MKFYPLMNIMLTFIMSLLGMAFYTLLERKTLSYTQRRKGPNKISILGFPQPLADALKLLSKEMILPNLSNKPPFILSSIMTLFLSMFMWVLYPSMYPTHYFYWGVLLFICISSLNVYSILMAGWSSNSKYSLLGTMRSIAQSISYEISMLLTLLNILLMTQSYDMSVMSFLLITWTSLIFLPLFLSWSISILAETNRAPFDFTEGESELVSGFNTEFSAGMFTMIFMAEYLSIMFISMMTAMLFTGSLPLLSLNSMFFMLKSLMCMFMFLWIRSCYPRLRYDQLMNLCWKTLLPFALASLLLFIPMNMML